MRFAGLLPAALLATCSAVAAGASPDNFVIFDASKTGAMLAQCSRGTPGAGEAGWKPDAHDIARLEAALPAALAKVRAAHPHELDGAPAKWLRQYVGIVRGGRRFIYGNFAPAGDMAGDWRKEPFMVCDGGVGFFGAEFDIEAGTFTHLDFNGYA